MVKNKIYWLIVGGLIGLVGCGSADNIRTLYPGKLQISVVNKSDFSRPYALVQVNLNELAEKKQVPLSFLNSLVVLVDGVEVPSQKVGDELYFCQAFGPRGEKQVVIRSSVENRPLRAYEKRAHAELSKKVGGYFKDKRYIGGEFTAVQLEKVPDWHIDHDTYYRYEGPGWESDKVGYRYYLDQRNRIDIFGKKVNRMVLPNVGLDSLDLYHEMSDWGMDIFKVGESLGIGSIATFYQGKVVTVSETDSITCEITNDGPLVAEICTRYYGWRVGDRRYDLESNLSIAAGRRLTEHRLVVSGQLENLVTGLVKTAGCDFIAGQTGAESEWNYIGLWGKQSLAGDNLGTALFYRTADLVKLTENESDHLVILQPHDGQLGYYFAAAWEQEPAGITSKGQFEQYLHQTDLELNQPIEITY
jgi:hypothetical protein